MSESYRKLFSLDATDEEAKRKVERALEHALDIRKFEIGLYWQRAAYFWALIAGAFAAYAAILSADNLKEQDFLAYVVGCVGLVFTWAWFLVNRGSKFWQENWENHVDMLEDAVTGPLYKTVLKRPPEEEEKVSERLVLGPAPYSPSKINQWVAVFTLCIWIVLILHILDLDPSLPVSWKHVPPALITFVFGVIMTRKGRTHEGDYTHTMAVRKTRIA